MDKKKAGNSERTAGSRQVDKAYRAGVTLINQSNSGNLTSVLKCT